MRIWSRFISIVVWVAVFVILPCCGAEHDLRRIEDKTRVCKDAQDCASLTVPADCQGGSYLCLEGACTLTGCLIDPPRPEDNCDACAPVELPCQHDPRAVNLAKPLTLQSDELPAGSRANHIIIEDLDDDGHRDLAIFYSVPGVDQAGAAVFSGNGTGQFAFQGAETFSGTKPLRATVADFNGDGVADFAIYCQHASTVTIKIMLRMREGSGHTADYAIDAGALPGVGGLLTPITAGDVDADGDIDVAVGTSSGDWWDEEGPGSRQYLLINRGDGSFDVDDLSLGSIDSFDMILDDFNGDGLLDIAAAAGFRQQMQVFLGDGAGDFSLTATLDYGMADSPEMILSADYDCDEDQDIRTLHESCYDAYYAGHGDGTFDNAVVYLTEKDPTTREAVGDFNGDGNQDLVLAGYGMDLTFLLLDDSGQVLNEVNTTEIGIQMDFGGGSALEEGSLQVATGDLNHDCLPDVVVGIRDSKLEYWGNPNAPAGPIVNIFLADPCGNSDVTEEDDYSR